MNDIQRAILFLGDSFTWGEGLELYSDTPKWIAERNKHNEWDQLSKIQDDESILFRESNRFPSLVSKQFGVKPIVDIKNGGCFSSMIDTAEEALFNPSLYIDTIIIQFSQFDRNHLHTYPGCLCEFCRKTENSLPYANIPYILTKLLNFENITPNDQYILNYFENKLKLEWNDPTFLSTLEMDTINWYTRSLQNFIEIYINKWKSYGRRKIYYINSWDHMTADVIKNNIFIYDNIIPLMDPDGGGYISWNEWASTFEYKSIADEFPKTLNHHPTLLQHKFLANSIIQHLIENNYE